MPARYEQIREWVDSQAWRRGAELGVFDGSTLLYLLEHCPRLFMVAVDVWDCDFKESRGSGERCKCQYCEATRLSRHQYNLRWHESNVLRKATGKLGRTVIYKMTTTEAARFVDDRSLDFVFIDADHSTAGVRRDILDWRHKVRMGGKLIGHDWNMKSVRTAVEEIFRPDEIETGDDHVWYVDL